MKTQYSVPSPGSKVTITTEFPSYIIVNKSKINKTTITGIVEKATRFTPPDCIRIVTDFDSPVRVREIPLHRIVHIEYADGRKVDKQIIKVNNKSWTVSGSKGSCYTVICAKSAWTCTCPGFQFRKNCRHIQELQNANH